MTVSIELSKEQTAQLKVAAEKLGIQPEELARAAVTDLLDPSRGDFDKAASYVVKKNAELYKRLS